MVEAPAIDLHLGTIRNVTSLKPTNAQPSKDQRKDSTARHLSALTSSERLPEGYTGSAGISTRTMTQLARCLRHELGVPAWSWQDCKTTEATRV